MPLDYVLDAHDRIVLAVKEHSKAAKLHLGFMSRPPPIWTSASERRKRP